MNQNMISRRQLLAALSAAGVASIGLAYGAKAESSATVYESVYSNGKKKGKEEQEEGLEHVLHVSHILSLIGRNGFYDGQQIVVQGYHAGTNIGGGLFYWDAVRPKSSHNGGDTISPTASWDGTASSLPSFLSGSQETNPGGQGCWIRLKEEEQVFDPASYGATGNGNEQEVIQAVLDAARDWSVQHGNRRPVVRFQTMYTVNGAQVYDGFVLLGPGGLKREDGVIPNAFVASSTILFGNGVKDIDIAGMMLDGNVQGQGVMQDPLYRQGKNAGALGYQNIYIIGKYANPDRDMGTIRIQDCRIINSPGNGIVINNHSQAVITGNHIERCGKNGIYLAQTHGFNTSVANNYIRECGFVYGGGIGVAHAHVNVSHNTIVNSYEYGILISSTGVGARWNTDITISGNNIRGVKRLILDQSGDPESYRASSLGIGIGYTQVFVTRASSRHNVAITGNSIQGAEGSGISYMGSAYNAAFLPHGISITGNVVMHCGAAGINVRYIRGLVCTGNMVMTNGFANLYIDDVAGTIAGNTIACSNPASDRVIHKGIRYEAAKRHLSSAATEPGVSPDCWTVIQSSETLPEWHEDEVYTVAGRPSSFAIYAVYRPSGAAVSGKRGDLLLESNQLEGVGSADRISNIRLGRSMRSASAIEQPVDVGDRIYDDVPAAEGREGRICIAKGTDTDAQVWSSSAAVQQRERRIHAGKLYEAQQAGTTGAAPPVHTSGVASGGTVAWAYVDTVAVWNAFGRIAAL